MRRARHHAAVSLPSTASIKIEERFGSRVGFEDEQGPSIDSALDDVTIGGARGDRKSVAPPRVANAERDRHLEVAIMQRIESRLPGRVRNLRVRVAGETVVLEGECSTYYTKQLAQHAALGILEEEQLENSITVTIGR